MLQKHTTSPQLIEILERLMAMPLLSSFRLVGGTALIVGLGQEADGDYHLILTSADGSDSLIAEIPDTTCKKVKGFPGLVKDYTAARQFIEDNIDQSPGSIHYLQEGMKVKTTGVVFFDKMAHGNGHAPNGVEIHPVLGIEAE